MLERWGGIQRSSQSGNAVMDEKVSSEITQLLIAWGQGDQVALDRLMPMVYDELHKMASYYFRRERQDHTLQTTAVVHEAYLRLIDQRRVDWQNRAQFFGIAAQMIRRILIDHARGQASRKRGGDQRQVALEDLENLSIYHDEKLLALHQSLTDLAEIDPPLAKLVELRFFGGLNNDEVAVVLRTSERTVRRQWLAAKAWLHLHLAEQPS